MFASAKALIQQARGNYAAMGQGAGEGEEQAMASKCAVLDDYQNVSLEFADWSRIAGEVDVTVFNEPIGSPQEVVRALAEFDIVCLMRERTPFPREVIDKLPRLKLLVTTGLRNAAIDLAAAADRGITVCGTQLAPHPTAELVFAHMLEFARKVGVENARLKGGAAWQATIGRDLNGKTLGVIGLGRLGRQVARIGEALAMTVLAWSQNLTTALCEGTGATLASKEELLRASDFVTVHLQLSERTRGLIGKSDLALMKPSAFLINTSRGPIVEEAALVDALSANRIAGAGLDVFDIEPLPLDHPFRSLPNAQITPHLGYVTEDNYRLSYGQVVEDIRAWLDNNPLRIIAGPC
jgi:phosphoglycerate dehydrogenase-like enzyme